MNDLDITPDLTEPMRVMVPESSRQAGKLSEIFQKKPEKMLDYLQSVNDRVFWECGYIFANVNRCTDDSGIREQLLGVYMEFKRSDNMIAWEKDKRLKLDDLVRDDVVLKMGAKNWKSYSKDQRIAFFEHYAKLYTQAFSDGAFHLSVPGVSSGQVSEGAGAEYGYPIFWPQITFDEETLETASFQWAMDAMEHEMRHHLFYSMVQGLYHDPTLQYFKAQKIEVDVRIWEKTQQMPLKYKYINEEDGFGHVYTYTPGEIHARANEGVRSSRLLL